MDGFVVSGSAKYADDCQKIEALSTEALVSSSSLKLEGGVGWGELNLPQNVVNGALQKWPNKTDGRKTIFASPVCY